jgi:tRNA modification GTPase
MMFTETIAAIATPAGQGGLGVIRVSGPEVVRIIPRLLQRELNPRHASFGAFYTTKGETLDEGIALFFPNPNSFTGDDVLELHGHGSPVVLNMILEELFAHGIRLARPGEFSERAFLNGKKDLVEIEAVADLIAAQSGKAAKMALRTLQGAFSKEVKALAAQITQIRVYVESAIDFPEEEIDFLSDSALLKNFQNARELMAQTIKVVGQGALLREGIRVVIMGEPNAGKSSLLNLMSGESTAIVTDIPGTTRDVLTTHVVLAGVPVCLIDTAGLRETEDVIEQEGVRRALAAMAGADHVLVMIDSSKDKSAALPPEFSAELTGVPITYVMNKIDLTGKQAGIEKSGEKTLAFCSMASGAGLEDLQKHILAQAGLEDGGSEGLYLARARHCQALAQASSHLEEAFELLQTRQGELVAEALKWSHRALGEILGEFTTDDLLGEIFSQFCIGK